MLRRTFKKLAPTHDFINIFYQLDTELYYNHVHKIAVHYLCIDVVLIRDKDTI